MSFIKKLYFSYLKSYYVLYLSVSLKCYFLSTIYLLRRVSIINKGRKKYRILCLSRSIFMDDVRAMALDSEDCEYLVVPAGGLKYVWKLFNKNDPDFKKLTGANYYSHDYCLEGKKKYHNYIRKIFYPLKKKLKFDAILSGNFSYVYQQELCRVSQEDGIPFIVLHKEGLSVQNKLRNYIKQYKERTFAGSKMLLYNDRLEEALLEVGVAGITKDKVQAVGIPRLDYYFKMKKTDQKQITFFSFHPYDKFKMYIEEDSKMRDEIEQISRDFHYMIFKFAENHPGYTIVVKTKVGKKYVRYVTDIIGDEFSHLDNISLTNNISPKKLIENSSVIAGYNSTTLIEGIIAKRLVVTPYFGDLISEGPWDYFYEYSELVNYVKNIQDLEEYVSNIAQYLNYSDELKNKFLKDFIYKPDGNSRRRAESAIIQTVQDYAERFKKDEQNL